MSESGAKRARDAGISPVAVLEPCPTQYKSAGRRASHLFGSLASALLRQTWETQTWECNCNPESNVNVITRVYENAIPRIALPHGLPCATGNMYTRHDMTSLRCQSQVSYINISIHTLHNALTCTHNGSHVHALPSINQGGSCVGRPTAAT